MIGPEDDRIEVDTWVARVAVGVYFGLPVLAAVAWWWWR